MVKRFLRRLRTRPPIINGSYVWNADGVITDTVLGVLSPLGGLPFQGFHGALQISGYHDVSLSVYKSDGLASELSYLRTVVGAIKLHDQLYRTFAAQDVWIAHRHLYKGPTLRPREFAQHLRLFWIRPVLAADTNLGVNLMYKCQNLIPDASVCVTLDHKARYYSGAIG